MARKAGHKVSVKTRSIRVGANQLNANLRLVADKTADLASVMRPSSEAADMRVNQAVGVSINLGF